MEEPKVLTPEVQVAAQNKVKESEAKPYAYKGFDDISVTDLNRLYDIDRKEFRKDIKKYNEITQEKIRKERVTYQKKKAEYYKVINKVLTGKDLQYIITQMKGVLQAVDLTKADSDNLSATLIRKGIITQDDLDSTDGILKKEAAEKIEMKKVTDKKE